MRIIFFIKFKHGSVDDFGPPYTGFKPEFFASLLTVLLKSAFIDDLFTSKHEHESFPL